jgi:hypothetical protein
VLSILFVVILLWSYWFVMVPPVVPELLSRHRM